MPEQLNWHLTFTGHAIDARDGDNTRQQGIGTLTIWQQDGTEVASFAAISGPGINGLLPNGKYTATKFTEDSDFPDEKNLSYKIFLDPVGPLAVGFTRSQLRIHPTQLKYVGPGYIPGPTDGCIGLVGNDNAEPFMNYIKPYLNQYVSIDLEVDVVDNANVKIDIGNKLNYV